MGGDRINLNPKRHEGNKNGKRSDKREKNIHYDNIKALLSAKDAFKCDENLIKVTSQMLLFLGEPLHLSNVEPNTSTYCINT